MRSTTEVTLRYGDQSNKRISSRRGAKAAIFGAAASTLWFITPSVDAQVVSYNFDNSTATAAFTAAGVTASSFNSTGTTIAYNGGNPSTGKGISTTGWSGTATGVNAVQYWDFTLTPSTGASMSLSSFSFDDQTSSSGGSFQLAYRLGSSGAFTTIGSSAAMHTSFATNSYSGLSSISALQVDTSVVDFRIFGWNAPGSGTTWRIDNVIVGGTASLPSLAWTGSNTTTPAASDTSATWDTSTTNWSNGSSNVVWSDGSNASFGAGSGTSGAVAVTLAAARTAANVTFATNSPGYTLSGNTLTVTGAVTNNDSVVQTLALPLTLGASASLVTASSGNLAVSSSGNAVSLGSFALTTTAAANTTISIPGNISGSGGSVVKTGAGILALSGTNSYTGATTVSAGELDANSSGALSSSTILTFNNSTGQTLVNVANGTNPAVGGVSLPAAYAGSSAITTGTGKLVLGGDVNYTGTGTSLPLSISGNLDLGAAVRTFTIASNANAAGDVQIAANIVNTSGGLTKAGSGILALSGSNTYSGPTTILGGELDANSTGALPSATVLNFTNATGTTTLKVANGIAATVGGINLPSAYIGSSPAGAAITTGTGTLNLNGDLTYTGSGSAWPLSISGNLNLGSASRNFTIASNGNSTVGGDVQVGAAVSGTAGLTLSGGGILVLSGNNNYSGSTNANGGTLWLGNANAVGTSTVNLGDTAGTSNAEIDLTLNGATVANAVTVRSGSSGIAYLNYGGTTGIGTFSGPITLNKSVSFGAPGTSAIYSGNISGSGAVTINNYGTSGAGTVQMSGASIYSGGTSLSNGSLLFGSSTTLSGVTIVNGPIGTGALTVSGTTGVIGAVTAAQTVANPITLTNTLTASGTQPLTLSGVLSSSGGLTAAGTSTLKLTNTNTYTGTTTVTSGTLTAANVAALGTAAAPLKLNGGSLDLATDSSVNSYNTALAATSTIYSDRATSGAGITHTLGTLSAGGFTLNVAPGSNVASGTAGVTFGATNLTGAVTFSPTTGTSLTLGTLSGTSTFTKAGAGTLTLNSSSSRISGAINVNGGTLRIGNSTATGVYAGSNLLTVSSAAFELNNVIYGSGEPNLILNDGATFRGFGTSQYAAFTSASYPSIGASSKVTFSAPSASDSLKISTGVRDGAGATINVLGGGVVELSSGSSSSTTAYDGAWTVNMDSTGVFRLDLDISLGAATATRPLANATVFSGTMAINNGVGQTVSNPITLAGGSLAAAQADTHKYSGLITLQSNTTSTVSTVDAVDGTGTTPRIVTFSNAAGITGSGNLSITGTGMAVISGTSNYTGTTAISGGRLNVEGTHFGGNTYSVNAGGTLGGGTGVTTGTGGTIDAPISLNGGVITAGTSTTTGTLKSTSTTFTVASSSSTFTLKIGGTTAGTSYDQIQTSATSLALNGAILNLIDLGNYFTTIGKGAYNSTQSFVIVTRPGTAAGSAATGTFKDALGNTLANGAIFDAADTRFKINYGGGDGNDIQISEVPEPTALTLLGVATLGLLRRRRSSRTARIVV